MATAQGTLRFAERVIAAAGLPRASFRTTLASTGRLCLSSLGVGTYMGSTDAATQKQVEDALERSVRGGVNVLDSAVNYRDQLGERAIGSVLRRLIGSGDLSRDEIFVSSKVGYCPGDATAGISYKDMMKRLVSEGVISAQDSVDGRHCTEPKFMRRCLDMSLRNLGVETIDLLYLHNFAENWQAHVSPMRFMTKLQTAFEFCEAARERGKIRFYGLATWTSMRVPPTDDMQFLNLETVVRMAEVIGGGRNKHGLRFLMVPLSLAAQEALVKRWQVVGGSEGRLVTLLQAAEELGIGVFASAPLGQGAALPLCSAKNPAVEALEFVRSVPCCSTMIAPIVGQKTPEHVSQNLEILRTPPRVEGEITDRGRSVGDNNR